MFDANRTTPGRYFVQLNFHPSQRLQEIADWLEDPAGLPLALQGVHGSGREYCLRAVCHERELRGRPWSVVSVDWKHETCQDPGQFVQWLTRQQGIQRPPDIDWLALLAETFSVEKGPGSSWLIPLTLVVSLASSLKLARALLAAWSLPDCALPEKDAFPALRRLLEAILADRHLVLHVRNAELLDSGMTQGLLDLGNALDAEAVDDQRHGRLLLAFSCSEEARPAMLLGRRRLRQLLVSGLPAQQLRQIVDRNFSPNQFGSKLIDVLCHCSLPREGDRLCAPALLAGPMNELLTQGVLIWEKGCWILNPDVSEHRLNNLVGKPLRDLYQERLRTVPDDLRPAAERFMELAALCRQWIPQQLLLEWMGLDEAAGDRLLDSVEDAFASGEPALLVDEEYLSPGFPLLAVYRFAFPLLAVSLLPRDGRREEAEQLLAFFEQRLPAGDRASAGLCWQLAEQAGTQVREQWLERLAWHFAPERADLFADMLLERLHAGLLSPGDLLARADQERRHQSFLFLQAAVSACNRWHQSQGGIPWNQEGALLLNLEGILLNKLGRHEEALEKAEEALAICKAVLPAGHPDIAASLSRIGLTLHELGRHEEALEKIEAALAIRKAVLPAGHPNIAVGLSNIGLVLGKLGRHEEALEKIEAALAVLPAGHPDIAASLNNIGFTLHKLGRHEEALEKVEANLAILKAVLPAGHPNIAASLNNIGLVLGKLGRHEEALEKIEAALAILKAVLPAGHPDIAASLNNIGLVLGKLGRHEEALEKKEAGHEELGIDAKKE